MELEKMMKALGDPTRLHIYRRLLERRHCVRSLSGELGITESAVSQHVKVLRECGLVYGVRFGRHVHFLPDPAAAGFLADRFTEMKKQSEKADREPGACSCAGRRGET